MSPANPAVEPASVSSDLIQFLSSFTRFRSEYGPGKQYSQQGR